MIKVSMITPVQSRKMMITGIALTQFTSASAGEGTVAIKDATSLLLIGMGLLGLTWSQP